MRTVQIKAPRGPLKLDAYDNPIQNVYISQGREDQTPRPRRSADHQTDKDLRGGVTVLDLDSGRVPGARTLQALTILTRAPERRPPAARAPSASLIHIRPCPRVILQAINGISLAALLFLLASGFTLTFGLMRVVNMAYGAYYLLGGYIGYRSCARTGSFELAMLGGGLSIVVLGYLVDRFLIRSHRQQPSRAGAAHRWRRFRHRRGVPCDLGRRQPAASRRRPGLRGAIALPGGLFYPKFRFALIVFGTLAALLLWLLYHKTQIGAVVRAGVDDREMVNATGINVDRLFVLVSALASFLAGVAGVVGGAFLTLNPGAEWDILVLALVVVIIGGLGSLEGAILGSIIVGLLDAYGRWLLPEFSYFVLFGPMAILLLFRATGIFGKEH